MAEPTPQTPSKPAKLPAKERLKLLFAEYGSVAVGTFLVLWVSTLGAIYTAMKFGWSPESAGEQAGTFGAAYVVFRFTMPLRVGATFVLTPIVAKVLERLRLRRPRPPAAQ